MTDGNPTKEEMYRQAIMALTIANGGALSVALPDDFDETAHYSIMSRISPVPGELFEFRVVKDGALT